MYKGLVACSAGMSTRMIVQKIQKEANAQEVDLSIEAVSMNEGKSLIKKNDFDLLLLGPQVSFMEEEMQKMVNGKFPVKTLNQKDYGLMRAESVLKDIIQTVDNPQS